MSESTRKRYPPTGPELLLEMWLASAEGADDAELVQKFHVSKNTAAGIRYARTRHPKRQPVLEQRLRDGDIISLNQLMFEAGYTTPSRRQRRQRGAVKSVRLSADGREINTIAYGKGDPWREVSEPMRRYLRGWRSREFQFRHLNPKEAGERVLLIDEIVDGLQKAREDLVARSHKSSYAAPHNTKRNRKETSHGSV